MAYEVRLAKEYKDRILPELMKQFGYTSVMQAPKVTKICLSRGLGEAIADKKILEAAANEFGLITGQKPIITKSKKTSPTLSFVRECQSAVLSRFVATKCTNFLIA